MTKEPPLTHCRFNEVHCGDMLFTGWHIVEEIRSSLIAGHLDFKYEGEEGFFLRNAHEMTAVFRREDWSR